MSEPTDESTGNPYSSPMSVDAVPVRADTPFDFFLVIVASLLCGAACYIPFLGLRGAAFCLYPGIVKRSGWMILQGVLIGLMLDFVITIVWMPIAGAWETRWGGYHHLLAFHLPPDHIVATHVGSPMPNSLKFGAGLTVWLTTMFAAWVWLQNRTRVFFRNSPMLVFGAALAATTATFLWTVAPLHTMLRGEYWQPFADLPEEQFVIVFFTTMPICSLIFAVTLHSSYFHSKSSQALQFISKFVGQAQ